MKQKEFSKNSLLKFYYSCPLFKKYCKLGLWFGSFEEYKNIRYCEKYLREYTCFILQENNLFIHQSLSKDPYFKKFLHSGFFCCIDSHFLKAFYKNSFLYFSPKSKLRIKNFVENYFQKYLKGKLKKKLLIYAIKHTNKFMFSFLESHTKNLYFYYFFKINKCYKFVLKNNKNIKSVSFLNKKRDIQILFEHNTFLCDFNEKKKSIGSYNSIDIVFEKKIS